MGLSFFIIATCLVFGFIAALVSVRPNIVPELRANLRRPEALKQFSPRNTLFLIGPGAIIPPAGCSAVLLKPAIAGADPRRCLGYGSLWRRQRRAKNGEPIDWLDPALLRHALNAEARFFHHLSLMTNGKTLLPQRSAHGDQADILRIARCLDISAPPPGGTSRRRNHRF